MPKHLIVVNGRLFLDGARVGPPPEDAPTAVVIENGKISALTSDVEAARLRHPRAEVIDAGGGLVLPGFDDAHIHVIPGGQWYGLLALKEAATVRELQDRVAKYAAAHPELPWIWGGGWRYATWGDAAPAKEALDAVLPDRPAMMVCTDGHSYWVNSAALRAAGIDRHTPDPPNGTIVRDPATGEPTGWLKERAGQLIYRVMPEPSHQDLKLALRRAVRALNASGFTAVQDARTDPGEVPVWREALAEGHLTLRSRIALPMAPEQSLDQWRATLDEHADLVAPLTGDWLTSGIVKGFVDGVIESRTAAMLAPYEGEESAGTPAFEPEQLTSFTVEAHRRGWQVQLHAIGDRAVRMALDAFAAAGRRRHRVEHVEVIDPADVGRFAALDVVASMQPMHAFSATDRAHGWHRVIGPGRAATNWPMSAIHAAGGAIALGSDWPVVDFDPFTTLHAAMSADHALTLPQALTAYGHGSAYAAHAEHRRGSVAVGMDADLAVLDRDPLADGDVRGTGVAATIVDGLVVHRAG
ncbi:amidohydrolase [Acrocarpospora macrocephala]|uniref:Amidohydrolase n=1 Tax=Acrocarpospora macrocephala TaxID=150177 RepID=A0A5M3WR59_9ACTN|nr:amidohydrolase [Acrocarpospora macrocephala]GES09771.1 amidohydrolase [Acrocarpospora macrocephala]